MEPVVDVDILSVEKLLFYFPQLIPKYVEETRTSKDEHEQNSVSTITELDDDEFENSIREDIETEKNKENSKKLDDELFDKNTSSAETGNYQGDKLENNRRKDIESEKSKGYSPKMDDEIQNTSNIAETSNHTDHELKDINRKDKDSEKIEEYSKKTEGELQNNKSSITETSNDKDSEKIEEYS